MELIFSYQIIITFVAAIATLAQLVERRIRNA